jgi:hypothetical protein
MTKTKKIKGGVRLSSLYQGTRDQAMIDFLDNSTYTFLSNGTISCMAVLANLNAGINSNFRSCRSNNLDAHVRQLFVKLMLVDNNAADTAFYPIPNRIPHNGIEVATLADFQAEIDTQKQIYRTTLMSESSFLDSLCPSIVGTGFMVAGILPGLTNDQQVQLNQILGGVAGTIQLRCIAMEMMEGFRPAYEVLPRLPNGNYDFTLERSRYLYRIIQYEFTKLNIYGFFHGDAHFGNVMINPNYPYFSNDPAFLGRAIILDFGRTTRITPEDMALVVAGRVANNITYVYPFEYFYTDNHIGRRWDITYDMYREFRVQKILYLNTLRPLFVANFPALNANIDNVIDLLREQMQVNYPHLYFGGRAQKIENVFEIVSENNKMENNSKFEIEETIRMNNEFLERFKSHKCDWSEFLKPIKEQLETMDFKEVIGILRDEYDNKYSENVLLTIKPADKKNDGKRNDGKRNDGKRNDGKRKSKKNQKNRKTQKNKK